MKTLVGAGWCYKLAEAISPQQLLAGESNLYVATSLLKTTYQLTAGIACMQSTACGGRH
jgi:hypothetical protein